MDRSEKIEEVLYRIREVWVRHPSLRLGQLLVSSYQRRNGKVDIFYVEDDELIELVEDLGKMIDGALTERIA